MELLGQRCHGSPSLIRQCGLCRPLDVVLSQGLSSTKSITDQGLQDPGGGGLLVDSTDEPGDLDDLRYAALPPHRSKGQERNADLYLADDRFVIFRRQVEQLEVEVRPVALQLFRPLEEILEAECLSARLTVVDHQGHDRPQGLSLALPSVLLPDAHTIAQQLEGHQAVPGALVLQQQIDMRLAALS